VGEFGALLRWLLVVALSGEFAWAGMATRRWGTPPAGPAAVRAARPRAKPPTCYVAETQAPPELDGRLDDAGWKQARAYHLARTLDGAGDAPQPTEVRLLRDARTLYLAFRCTEPLLGKLQASRRGRDGEIWRDDSIEVFIGAGDTYYQFGVNAVGSTMDAQRKDASWNSGFRAAAARGRAAWTAEMAIPLAAMAGEGEPPAKWTASFNRNRHAAGTWQESAWSPTWSGDSHVPARFGTMLFRDPPPDEPAQRPAVRRKLVEILPAKGGEGIVRFDLSALPKGTTVFRADLLVYRTTRVDGRMDEARTDIEVHPLVAQAEPRTLGEPLALRPPWFDRFGATEAVRGWVAGKPNGGFFVKACPFWNAEATCLDVWYEGSAKDVPLQATGLRAFHRAGQTFLTWREMAGPVGSDAIRWGQLKRILDGLDAERRVRYCVYRHSRRITARNLHEAELLAVVKPLSCWNVGGRNIDRPIDQVIATRDVLPTHHWNPFRDASVDGPYGRDCPIDRFVIREGDGPLPRGTGLYVHTATERARAYYAVVTCVGGVQNTIELSEANALRRPVAESPAEPEPVLQGELPRMPFFNFDQKRRHYVRWVASPLANVPYQYHNWSVGLPTGLGKGAPLELSLHRDGHSCWRTQYRIERDSIVLCPYDFPMRSWWYGYHESLGTLRSFRQGRIQPYAERRLLSFIAWACRRWPVDRSRILVTGCRGGASASGALHLGLRHPGVFSLVIAGHPIIDYTAFSRRTDRHAAAQALSMQAAWGRPDWDTRTGEGRSFWDQHDLVKVLAATPPTAELPYVAMSSSHTEGASRRFYEAMLSQRRGLIAEFEWGGTRYIPVSATGTSPNVIRLDIRLDKACLALVSPQSRQLVSEGKMGRFHTHLRWRDVADEPGQFAATIAADANSLREPVAETPATAQPVLQWVQEDRYKKNVTEYWYRYWAAPPYCNLPGRSFRVAVAEGHEFQPPGPLIIGSISGAFNVRGELNVPSHTAITLLIRRQLDWLPALFYNEGRGTPRAHPGLRPDAMGQESACLQPLLARQQPRQRRPGRRRLLRLHQRLAAVGRPGPGRRARAVGDDGVAPCVVSRGDLHGRCDPPPLHAFQAEARAGLRMDKRRPRWRPPCPVGPRRRRSVGPGHPPRSPGEHRAEPLDRPPSVSRLVHGGLHWLAAPDHSKSTGGNRTRSPGRSPSVRRSLK